MTVDNIPKNIDAERRVLGSIFINPECLIECTSVLDYPDSDWFYVPLHNTIWRCINEAYNDGEPIEALTVSDRSGEDLMSYITGLVVETQTSGSVGAYLKKVYECHVRRGAIDEARETANKAIDMSFPIQDIPTVDIIKEHDEHLDEDPGLIDEDDLHIPGFVNDVMEFTKTQFPYHSKYMDFCGALSLMSTIISRRVTDEENSSPNLYILGLAESGSGKDGPRKINRRILHQAGTECRSRELGQIAFDEFASKESIEDVLKNTPTILWQKDEMDGILKSMDGHTNDNSRKMMEILLQLFTSSNGVYTTRMKAGAESIETIINPSLNLFGTCLPGNFYDSMSDKMLRNGLFGRMLIVENNSERTPNPHMISNPNVPSHITDVVKYWWLSGGLSDGYGGVTLAKAGETPNKRVLKYTPQAKDLIRTIQAIYDKEWNVCQKDGDSVGTSVWGRAYEMTRKLAMSYKISGDYQAEYIDWEAVEFSCRTIDRQCRRMLYKAREKSFGTDHEKQLNIMVEHLNRAPSKQLKRSEITAKMRHLTSKEITDILETLEEADSVKRWKSGGSQGRKAEYVKLK